MVAFWRPLLGYRVPPPPEPHPTWREWYVSLGVPADEIEGDGTDRLVPPEGGTGLPIWFQQVPEHKVGKNRWHLDVPVSRGNSGSRVDRRADIEAAVVDLVAQGASVVRWSEDEKSDRVFALMTDPEGNEFCLS